eukprot:Phypoly_transcript_16504.p1 GENE.Phypoly_transcript_16504~~Phypoly_transcript_16504.p1  ORF type:complete len:220 (+),score=47.35 Phypoly_transcript_16504:124-783(+)
MSLKPITLFGHKGGPNPPKVAILLNELNVPYEIVFKEFGDGPNGVKHPDFLKYNPNGRVPAIIDPNNGNVVVWESGAILQYVQKQYDKENKFGGKTAQEEADILSFLFFQVSGHGPSQGQVNWFSHYHHEKLPGAIERYTNETKRIYKIVDEHLKGRQFFVTDHFTIVDAAFYPWVRIVGYAGIDLETTFKNDYPNVYAWAKRIEARPSVVKTYADFNK